MPLALDSQEQQVCGGLYKHSVMTLLQRSPPINSQTKNGACMSWPSHNHSASASPEKRLEHLCVFRIRDQFKQLPSSLKMISAPYCHIVYTPPSFSPLSLYRDKFFITAVGFSHTGIDLSPPYQNGCTNHLGVLVSELRSVPTVPPSLLSSLLSPGLLCWNDMPLGFQCVQSYLGGALSCSQECW